MSWTPCTAPSVRLPHCLSQLGCGVLQAKGAYTKAGTWAPNEEEARMIEAIVDRDEEWDKSLEGREQYLDRPIQPPGLLGSGTKPQLSARIAWLLLLLLAISMTHMKAAITCSLNFLRSFSSLL